MDEWQNNREGIAHCGCLGSVVESRVAQAGRGVHGAVLSGFAIAPMAASQLGAGLCALGEEYGLPPLPDAQYRLFNAPEADQTVLAALS